MTYTRRSTKSVNDLPDPWVIEELRRREEEERQDRRIPLYAPQPPRREEPRAPAPGSTVIVIPL